MRGKLIAIEGVDSSGKGMQAKMLLKRLRKERKPAILVSFPRYETFSGQLVKKYLQGKFGSLKKVRPELAALLYALDRYNAMPFIEKNLRQGKLVVCDRYIASNIAHQAAKLKGKRQQRFIGWLKKVESELPQPDATVFLDLPVSVSIKLMKGRARKRDIHELDSEYLKATRRAYLALSKKRKWIKIDCKSRQEIRPRQEIHREIWEKLKRLL